MSISALSASQIAEAVRTNDDALLGSVGYVQTSMDVELRDARGQAVGQDELGEVAVSGPTVMLGYWNNPQATADTGRARTAASERPLQGRHHQRRHQYLSARGGRSADAPRCRAGSLGSGRSRPGMGGSSIGFRGT
ncbi:hypothetical protein G6F59_017502 [Rhizopus arrhizus]|nr:hypothetical protein G6F59_017502 [Rhizopus arrhizus]